MTHQIDVLSAQELCEPMYESSHCCGEEWSVFGGWFSRFLGRQLANKWLCITQNWLFCVVLVVRLQHVQFFRKNRRSFAWKCFVCELVLLDLAHLETTIQLTAVYSRAHTRKSTIHHLLGCHRRVSKHRDLIFVVFLSTNRHEFFLWAIDKLCGVQRDKIFLTHNCSWNIECILVLRMPKVVSISR